MDQIVPRAHCNRPILLVENDEDTVAALQILLEHEGYTSLSAPDVHNAIASLENLDPGLVLLDWSLADGTGEEVLTAARRIQRNPPVVLMTGNTNIGRGEQRPPADAVLHKPFHLDELLRIVERYYQRC